MKGLLIVFVSLILFSAAAQADMPCMQGQQSGEMKHHEMHPGMMGEGQMPMMDMCKPMMERMMGHGMMMKDMMQMMTDMMRMQKKMMAGMNPEESKAMMEEIDQKIEKMDKMMSDMMDMMKQGMPCGHMGEKKETAPQGEPPKTEHQH